MSTFRALFNVGGLAGAALASLLLTRSIAPMVHVGIVSLVMALVALQ